MRIMIKLRKKEYAIPGSRPKVNFQPQMYSTEQPREPFKARSLKDGPWWRLTHAEQCEEMFIISNVFTDL